ncbi:glutathione S-transferase [Alphaproteobacteria bacterium KMM 3653]|uniref:Glutathione S-transferase n=1 Tax=Harenicola maris TaxID=2841044 RepID=A0AAP2G846_9RHOB|nr:glutathione S-transferase [Harenicola maris]
MQLFYSPASPFARKCLVTLRETGQLDEAELVHVVGTPLDSSGMPTSHNPLGKLPALSRPDGPAIYDSRVICRFLDARKNAGLYPEGRIWETLTLEATGDGIMDAAVLMVYEGRCRPEDRRSPEWVEAQWAKVTRALGALTAKWQSHLAGPLDAGQIAVGCALGYLDFRHGDRDWRKGQDALAAWYAEFAERPSMQATVPVA